MSAKPSSPSLSPEHQRLAEPSTEMVAPWRKWGPYVCERSWGSVREDYSPDGCAWEFLTHRSLSVSVTPRSSRSWRIHEAAVALWGV